jgi:hypothetical protein
MRSGAYSARGSAPYASADGQWHSFGGSSAGLRGSATAMPRSVGNSAGTSERAPSTLAASRSSALGLGGLAGGTSRSGLNRLGRSGFNNFGLNNNIRFGFGDNGFNHFGGNRFGFGGFGGFGFNNVGFGFNRFGFGCCGFGFGLGFGRPWGWGFGWGWNAWDPFWLGLGPWNASWYDPWWDWNGFYAPPAIDYSAPPVPPQPPYVQPPPDQAPSDQSPYGQADNVLPFYATPPATSSSAAADSTGNSAAPQNPAPWQPPSNGTESAARYELLYLKTGDVYPISECWLADGKLHYLLNGGGEYSVDLSLIDFDGTVNENAKRGVSFTINPSPGTMKPSPGNPTSAPDANGSA